MRLAKVKKGLVAAGMFNRSITYCQFSSPPTALALLTRHGSGVAGVWTEPEDITLFIDSIDDNTMREYIEWDLEREHGDIGLRTLKNYPGPPLSSFGIAVRKAKPNTIGRDWINEVVNYVGRSVVQAKLALDRIHDSMSVSAADLHPKRIPANVQAIFNAAIANIEQRSSTKREVAFESIAVVGKDGKKFTGVALSRLAELITERHYRSASTRLSPRSVEDILDAANGYLRLVPHSSKEKAFNVAAFSELFYLFARDEYNEELVMAKSQIGGLTRFRSPSLSSISAFKPPPIRRESSGSIRIQTFPSSTTAKMASPPAGLGLDFSGG